MDDRQVVCCQCDLEMKPKEITFKYMGFHFNHSLLACPACGQVYIDEDLVKGRMKEVETLLEEK